MELFTNYALMALASYRICRLIIEDHVLHRMRDRIWRRFSPEKGIGYMITCYWCTSIWVSSLVVIMYTIAEDQTLVVCGALALSTLVGLIDRAS